MIETLKPGKQLDAIVADEVMGWVRWKYEDGEIRLHDPLDLRWLPRYGGQQTDEPYTAADTSCFRASTNIEAAFQVIQKLQDKGRFYFKLDSIIGGGWCVSVHDESRAFDHLPQPEIEANCYDDRELPWAICIAALKAVRFTKAYAAAETETE